MTNKIYTTPDGKTVTNVKSIKIGVKTYLYDGDDTWRKWKRLLVAGDFTPNEIDFYKNHVIITKISTLKETVIVAKEIRKIFNFDNVHVKRLIKKSGKAGRGCNISDLSADVIEFVVLRGMNGSIKYSELDSIPYRKMLFWKKILDVEAEKIKEDIGDEINNENVEYKDIEDSDEELVADNLDDYDFEEIKTVVLEIGGHNFKLLQKLPYDTSKKIADLWLQGMMANSSQVRGKKRKLKNSDMSQIFDEILLNVVVKPKLTIEFLRSPKCPTGFSGIAMHFYLEMLESFGMWNSEEPTETDEDDKNTEVDEEINSLD